MQKECSLIEGCQVDWSGEIVQVSVSEVDNPIKKAVDCLPEALANFLYCFYGQPIPQRPGDQLLPGEDSWDFENLMDFHNRQCHLNEYDSYSFAFSVKLPSAGYWNTGLHVVVEAGNEFQTFAFNASKGDIVAFSAILKSGLGTMKPVMTLREIRCIHCKNPLLTIVAEPPMSLYDEFVTGISSVLKFIFAPFVGDAGTLGDDRVV
ncbi:unnamed protein product [Notodromas monacha]|uniref:Uncharacterized protein n=1 Tax=Notodromas monacha TaxID=399045 RepID=A0A7R9BL51_9CRUS|nr:unnamed protein product [Notodromas monacha]CAG0916405.1 unnamed protein product [Notodromas monacha]